MQVIFKMLISFRIKQGYISRHLNAIQFKSILSNEKVILIFIIGTDPVVQPGVRWASAYCDSTADRDSLLSRSPAASMYFNLLKNPGQRITRSHTSQTGQIIFHLYPPLISFKWYRS